MTVQYIEQYKIGDFEFTIKGNDPVFYIYEVNAKIEKTASIEEARKRLWQIAMDKFDDKGRRLIGQLNDNITVKMELGALGLLRFKVKP